MSGRKFLIFDNKRQPRGHSEIVFDSLEIGFHGYNPGHIHISSQAQGIEILRMLVCGTSCQQGIYARMFTKRGKVSYWYVWGEELYKLDEEDYFPGSETSITTVKSGRNWFTTSRSSLICEQEGNGIGE